MKLETALVHAGSAPDPTTGAILPPIYQTATYVLEEVGRSRGYDYTRSSNPTRAALEQCLAALEGVEHCAAFSSGMAAVDAVLRLLSAGDHVIVSDDVYGGVYRLATQVLGRSGLTFSFVDTTDLRAVEQAITPQTRLIWVESPTNPLLKISDLAALAKLARAYSVLLAVDPTFATPCALQAHALGVDLVVHSTTKYISGHNQIIGGAVTAARADHWEQLKFIQKSVGAVPSPFDCWLTLLGVRTLALRMEAHSKNAAAVAEFLQQHPKVAAVTYPGLRSHPQYEIARAQLKLSGGMLNFELRGGIDSGIRLMNSVRLCALAESLGAVETMITHPASMTHASVPKEVREARGLRDSLVRLSVGVEAVEDIIQDLDRALEEV